MTVISYMQNHDKQTKPVPYFGVTVTCMMKRRPTNAVSAIYIQSLLLEKTPVQ